MSPSSERQWQGWYFDGRMPQRQPVAVRVMRDGLAIIFDVGGSRRWTYEQFRQTQGAQAGEPVRFEHGGDSPEVLIVPDVTILAAIRETAMTRGRRFHPPARRGRWVAATLATAVAILALGWVLYLWGIPALADAVAARLPVAWEAQLGAAVVDNLVPPTRRCTGRSQQAALEQIFALLTASGPAAVYRYTLIVSAEDAPNAFAAPGGYVVVTLGLLRLSDRPEEIAGVMAHEIQHVVHRHGTKLLVRELSMRAMVSLATGDLGGLGSAMQAARTLGTLRYRRADETAADRDAVPLLAAARIDPRSLVVMLQKLRRASAGPALPPYLSTHPAVEDRIAVLSRLAAQTPVDAVPLLPTYAWSEIGQICP